MHIKRLAVATLLAVGAISIPSSSWSEQAPTIAPAAILRNWRPEDSAQLRYFADMRAGAEASFLTAQSQTVLTSVNGRFFAALVRHGDVARDESVYELFVWSSDAVIENLNRERSTAPLRTIIRRSASNQPAISHIMFSSDEDAILFLTPDGTGSANVQRVNLSDGRSAWLTRGSASIRSFQYAGGSLVVSREPSPEVAPIAYPYAVIPEVMGISGTAGVGAAESRQTTTWRLRRVDDVTVLFRGREYTLPAALTPNVAMSPDGRNFIGYRSNEALPYYAVVRLEPRTGEYALIANRIIDQSASASVQWSPDSKHIALPAAVAGDWGRDPTTTDVSVYSPHTGQTQTVPGQPAPSTHPFGGVQDIRWISPTSFIQTRRFYSTVAELLRRTQPIEQRLQVDLVDGVWRLRDDAQAAGPNEASLLPEDLIVQLKQGPNEPPVLQASIGARAVNLTEPDTMLSTIWWSRTTPFSWQGPGGRLTGGLWLPRDYRSERLPLIIQTYGYSPSLFLPDGVKYGTEHSAQTLVAAGFAVIQIEGWDMGGYTPQTEDWAAEFVERLDTLIDALDDAGVIDTQRVALMGFSQAGFLAHYAVTHPGRRRLAAVIVNDSFTSDYFAHLQDASTGIVRAPFFSDPDRWMRIDPSMQISSVSTPALFAVHAGGGYYADDEFPAQAIATTNAFRIAGRPIEYLYFPRAEHTLTRPREQVAYHYIVRDWMLFWLTGALPQDRATADRWMILRERQQAIIEGFSARGERVPALPALSSPPRRQ